MRHHPLTLLVATTAAALLACSGPNAPTPPQQAAPAPASSAPAPLEPAEEARLLALFTPPGLDSMEQRELEQRQQAARDNPAKLDPWVALGHAWVRLARRTPEPAWYANADACATLALQLDPASHIALNLRALVLLNDHRFAEAREIAQRVLARAPDDAMALGTLSDAWLELGDYDAATDAAERMVALKPNLPSYSRVAWLLWLHNRVDEAGAAYRLAFDAGRGHRDAEPAAWVLTEAALLFWHKGDYEGAEAGADLALQVFPEFPPALVAKARARLALDDPRSAIPLLEQALARRPEATTARLLLDAADAAHDAPRAQEARRRLEALGAKHDPRTLALFLASRRLEAERAWELARAELERRPDLYSEDTAAFTLLRLGRLDEARRLSDRALRLNTPDASLLFHAGAIRVAQGEREAGRALLQRALALNPRFDPVGAEEARRLLNEEAP